MTLDTQTENSDMIEVLRDALRSAQLEVKSLRKDNYSLNEEIKRKDKTKDSKYFDEFFVYQTPVVTLPPEGKCTTTITTASAAFFYATKLVRLGTNFSFLIRDSTNDRQWSNIAIHADVGAGTAQLPLILPKPRYVAENSTITIDLFNHINADNPVAISFIGYKVYTVEATECNT